MRISIFLFLFVLLASLSVFSQASTQIITTKEGVQLQIELKPEKDTIMLGETTYISFGIKNPSEQKFCMTVGGDYRNDVGRPDSYKVTVVKEDGKPVSQPEVKMRMGGLIGCGRIDDKSTYVTKLFLPHWATFSETGTYKIIVKKSIALDNSSTYKLLEGKKEAFTAEVSTTIRIVPTEADQLGEVIDALGTKLVDSKNPEKEDSAPLLRFIDDRRTIKYFAQALEIYDDSFIVRSAAKGISKYDADEAWKSLEKASVSSSDEVRYAAADALESSRFPKALGILSKMKNDPDYIIRLRVVQGFAKVETEEAAALLREMLNDKHEEVRKQAKQYLDNRRQK